MAGTQFLPALSSESELYIDRTAAGGRKQKLRQIQSYSPTDNDSAAPVSGIEGVLGYQYTSGGGSISLVHRPAAGVADEINWWQMKRDRELFNLELHNKTGALRGGVFTVLQCTVSKAPIPQNDGSGNVQSTIEVVFKDLEYTPAG